MSSSHQRDGEEGSIILRSSSIHAVQIGLVRHLLLLQLLLLLLQHVQLRLGRHVGERMRVRRGGNSAEVWMLLLMLQQLRLLSRNLLLLLQSELLRQNAILLLQHCQLLEARCMRRRLRILRPAH